MRIFGTILFLVGLTYAAWFAAYVPEPLTSEEVEALTGEAPTALQLWWQSAGLRFVGGLLLMIVGGVVARFAANSKTETETKQEGSVHEASAQSSSSAEAVLNNIEQQLRELPRATEGDASKISEVLDHILNTDVPAFLEFKESLIEAQGLEHYAEVISHFAVLERRVARAWSALTDQVYGEVGTSVEKALGALESARLELSRSAAG